MKQINVYETFCSKLRNSALLKSTLLSPKKAGLRGFKNIIFLVKREIKLADIFSGALYNIITCG
jgi:hypothetical protein